MDQECVCEQKNLDHTRKDLMKTNNWQVSSFGWDSFFHISLGLNSPPD